MSQPAHHTFETPAQRPAWLRQNHASETELWVRIFKKATGQPSVTWDDCGVAARSDGRWDTACAGSATMVMPEYFLATLLAKLARGASP